MGLIDRLKKPLLPVKATILHRVSGEEYPLTGFKIEKGMFIECGVWEGGDICLQILDVFHPPKEFRLLIGMAAVISYRENDTNSIRRMRTVSIGYLWKNGKVIPKKAALKKYPAIPR